MFGGFVLKYVNNSNEKITIDSDLVLQKAFDEALIQGVQNGRRAEITILVMIMNANGLPFSPFPNALATPTRSEVGKYKTRVTPEVPNFIPSFS